MESRFNHAEEEDKIYSSWEKSGFFNPDVCIKKKVTKKTAPAFSIVLPPPNVTGTLHVGHAAMIAIEDIMVRFERMRGKRTLWVPGTDHAAIATQSKVENLIYKKEGKTRHDLGREELLRRVEEFAAESHDTIVSQVRKMGASIDWGREAYTLDENRSLAVRTAFKRMYDDGLIYRGSRLINWDPKLQTTVSDDEIEWIEEKAPLYYLKYGPFTIATARPETKFGDKYVVVHPKDKRYKQYKHGEQLELEWINGPVVATVIKDESIDMSFGTGAMTITPWHDATDYEIAERHGLEKEQIIDYQGKLLPVAGEFAGTHIKKARPAIIEKMAAKGLIEKTDENYTHRVATNMRGGGIIEPQIKEQWFVAVNKPFKLEKSKIKGVKSGAKTTLKELMKKSVSGGQIKILPERFDKTYFQWIDNLRDWCISRQIWYGHRVPVWYKNDKVYCGVNPPKGDGWKQDEDTLDTWFSSGLWTFSTLGWPKNTADFKNFHPTSVLETGYDILFFWVARMVLMSTYLLGDIPFKNIYLHGLVRDAQGRKMSKTLGNTIDPLDLIKSYGTDPVRLALVIGSAPGNDVKMSEDRVRGYRNFATKVWNASRFVMMNYEPAKSTGKSEIKNAKPKFTAEDKADLKEFSRIKKEVTKALDSFDLNRAGDTAYHYFWHTFADVVIEAKKSRLKDNPDPGNRMAAEAVLLEILTGSLKILHPFMPFVTEAVYQSLPAELKNREFLMIESW